MKWHNIKTSNTPVGRHETSFVAVHGKFYLIGGREANGRIEYFDPEKKDWFVMKAKSPLIHHFQPIAVGTDIYMVGAMTGAYPEEPVMGRVQIYDTKHDLWKEGAEIPENRRRGSSGTVLYKNKIYLACGIVNGHTSGTNNWFDEYDFQTDSWKKMPDAPRIRDHFHAVLVDDKMYSIGGRNTSYHTPENFGAFFGAVIPEIDVFDFSQDKWSTLPESANLPEGSAAGGVAVLNEKILYFGGETAKTALADCWSLDLLTNKWKSIGKLNQGRHGTQAITYQNAVYVACGSPVRGGGNLTSIEVLY